VGYDSRAIWKELGLVSVVCWHTVVETDLVIKGGRLLDGLLEWCHPVFC